MQFLVPAFLWTMAALAIPVIIHLFYFRRFKKVYFTNVRFLKEIKDETSTRSRIRNLLVLISRMLALAFLVLAFTQPFIPLGDNSSGGQKTASIYIDNSFSMNALSQDVPLIDKAKQKAREILEAYQVDDRIQVLTNDFEGRHQRLVSKDDALAFVDEIEIGPSVRELSKVLERQVQAMQKSSNDDHTAYILSDFQRNITDLESVSDSNVSVVLIPLQSVQERNISIDSCWFEAPVQMINQPNRLLIKIKNRSNQEAENIRLSMMHLGQEKPIGLLNIPPEGTVIDTANISVLKSGWHEVEIKITDYPVQFDDQYKLVFKVADDVRVLGINSGGPNKFLQAAFSGILNFELINQEADRLDYSNFGDYQLIVLNEVPSVSSGLVSALEQYVDAGGNLLVFPSTTTNISSLNALLKKVDANEFVALDTTRRQVARINLEEFIFSDVFMNIRQNLQLPVTKSNFTTTTYSNLNRETLLNFRDGTVFLSKYNHGRGNAYVSTAPLETRFNDLVNNAEIFVPMLYKMALSTGSRPRIAYTIGRDEYLEMDNVTEDGDLVYKVSGPSGEFIPSQSSLGQKVVLGFGKQIAQDGFYQIYLDEAEVKNKVAMNYDRKESDLNFLNRTELNAIQIPGVEVFDNVAEANFTQLIGERSRGIILWKWCLILALIFLGIETLLLRIWKTE